MLSLSNMIYAITDIHCSLQVTQSLELFAGQNVRKILSLTTTLLLLRSPHSELY